MTRARLLTLFLLLSGLLGAFASVQAQGAFEVVPEPEPAFRVYRCDFDRSTNRAQIRAVLMGADGLPPSGTDYSLAVGELATGRPVAAERVTLTPLLERPPLRMVLVLDITDTVPLREIVTAVSTQLVPRLLVQDELALITFSASIAPITPFFTDKNRLINEQLLDRPTEPGDNRIYDSVLQAVNDLKTSGDGRRQVVLVLADSGRRGTNQVSSDAIIQEARRYGIEVFTLAFMTRDRPDFVELAQLAYQTGGYYYSYDEIRNTRASIQSAVSDRLVKVGESLNSEVLIEIDLAGSQPDINQRVRFGLSVDLDARTLSAEANCPVEQLNHAIRFVGAQQNVVTSETIDLQVSFDSDLNPDLLSVAFLVNDQVVQNSAATFFRFETPTQPPGPYQITAQLRDRLDNVLSTTRERVDLYARQPLRLEVASGALNQPDQALTLAAVAGSDVPLPNAEFYLVQGTNRFLIANTPFSAGRAEASFDSLRNEIQTRLPGLADGAALAIEALVPGTTPAALPLTDTASLGFNYVAASTSAGGTGGTSAGTAGAAAAGAGIGAGITAAITNLSQTELPFWFNAALVVFGLLLFNLLLFLRVRRTRIQRLVNRPDNHELSHALMSITVRRGGYQESHPLTKKTMTIGRGASNDINLGDNPHISRKHGAIIWRRRKWYYASRKNNARAIIDGKSRRGFFLRELEPVTEIQIADALLLFHSSAQQDIAEFMRTNLD